VQKFSLENSRNRKKTKRFHSIVTSMTKFTQNQASSQPEILGDKGKTFLFTLMKMKE